MGSIAIVQKSITEMEVDAVVNAANEGLRAGSGVCGAIFSAAGKDVLQDACDEIGYCSTGGAVATPGFALNANYVVHAVGPRWRGGNEGEPALLASSYQQSLERARELGCRSIAFPLISSGIFGYPKEGAWRVALSTCMQWQVDNPACDLSISFCTISDSMAEQGIRILNELGDCRSE